MSIAEFILSKVEGLNSSIYRLLGCMVNALPKPLFSGLINHAFRIFRKQISPLHE